MIHLCEQSIILQSSVYFDGEFSHALSSIVNNLCQNKLQTTPTTCFFTLKSYINLDNLVCFFLFFNMDY